jgi:hypothetical protein
VAQTLKLLEMERAAEVEQAMEASTLCSPETAQVSGLQAAARLLCRGGARCSDAVAVREQGSAEAALAVQEHLVVPPRAAIELRAGTQA